jgi:hypothetical protein
MAVIMEYLELVDVGFKELAVVMIADLSLVLQYYLAVI